MYFCLFIASSSALMDFCRPTKSGTTMCGKTMMSRSGSSGTRTPVPPGPGVILLVVSKEHASIPLLRCADDVRRSRLPSGTDTIGCSRLVTTSSEISTSLIAGCDGISYMMSSMVFSRIARRPRAPDFRLSASRAIAVSAPSVNLSFTFSISKSFWYCLVKRVLRLLAGCARGPPRRARRAWRSPAGARRTRGSGRT